ncbi:uncharacterized protein K452DRAFT_292012 [Aplosporella prunicola CBS 121167]|uniref:Secreted protein n=1 Tax=Aplosporella prunicola CBS 121167 TaxID=1176127 RepID=A0A6A6B008_9PEZI|nr:uncharacterized protein K452DRAFT_292012 [Aplosporella prunicola CBS 121167]KAF2136868.1 hypothetical protein K452DRAFT_292012 [Aplosporella prunicola CBS 121167]
MPTAEYILPIPFALLLLLFLLHLHHVTFCAFGLYSPFCTINWRASERASERGGFSLSPSLSLQSLNQYHHPYLHLRLYYTSLSLSRTINSSFSFTPRSAPLRPRLASPRLSLMTNHQPNLFAPFIPHSQAARPPAARKPASAR